MSIPLQAPENFHLSAKGSQTKSTEAVIGSFHCQPHFTLCKYLKFYPYRLVESIQSCHGYKIATEPICHFSSSAANPVNRVRKCKKPVPLAMPKGLMQDVGGTVSPVQTFLTLGMQIPKIHYKTMAMRMFLLPFH